MQKPPAAAPANTRLDDRCAILKDRKPREKMFEKCKSQKLRKAAMFQHSSRKNWLHPAESAHPAESV